MQLANLLPELHRHGADLAAVVVDSAGRNAAMAQRWRLPFPIVSDPEGARILRPLDLWNSNEREGIAWPALLVLDPQGEEIWRLRARDFADRPPDSTEVVAALASLNLPEVAPPQRWRPATEPIDDAGAFRPDTFGPFFRGIRTSMLAVGGRLENAVDKAEVRRMRSMADAFLDAWKERRRAAW